MPAADPREVFLSCLPRKAGEQKALESGLYAALLAEAAVEGPVLDGDPDTLRLRMHTRQGGTGLGYAFAWLPTEALAQRLVAAGELSFTLQCDGAVGPTTCCARVSAARGHAGGRGPPAEPGYVGLSVAVCANFHCAPLLQAARLWRQLFRDAGLSLDVRLASGCSESEGAWLDIEGLRHCDLGVVLCSVGAVSTELGEPALQQLRDLGAAGTSLLALQAATAACATVPQEEVRVGAGSSASDPGPFQGLVGCRGIDVVSAATLEDLYPRRRAKEEEEEEPSCPGLDFGAICALIVRRAVACHLAPALKVFVADCDFTLWHGVVSEDGAEHLKFDGAFGLLQRRLSQLHGCGKLICLASKNDEADVMRVFDLRAGEMQLAWSQLAAWQVNWGPKARNLRFLADDLRLGLDSFVFLDDNPAEIEAVRCAVPQALVVQVPGGDPEAFGRLVRHHWALDVWPGASVATAEDAVRTQMYRDHAARKAARAESPSFEAFLASLEVRIEMRPPSGPEVARVSQLSVRTNQFNSTKLLLPSDGRVLDWLDAPGRSVTAAWVSDRFGDYGLVAAALCSPGEGALIVECFMMSCRVLHRGVEQALLRRVAEEAEAAGFERVLVPVVANPRNTLVRGFLARVAAWLDAPPLEQAEEATIGRYRGRSGCDAVRRGAVAPAYGWPAARLKALQRCHTSCGEEEEEGAEEGDAEARQAPTAGGKEAAATAGPTVAWGSLLQRIAEMGPDIMRC